MLGSFLVILLWAVLEEIVKLTGVRLAEGTKFSAASLVWFFVAEAAIKTFWLTEGFEFSSEQALTVYSGAAFLSVASSIIHLYTSIFYKLTNSVGYALGVCTLLHTAFNFYAAHGIKSVLVDPSYNQALATAWIMSTVFGVVIVIALKVERKFLPA
ncbi:hypothetical protein [Ensifer adhaerens]|uniref:hypothetical protein n=1 Tax=Ensifer adhaerens TaxID=106592 RepID=UPI0011785969|nr:hypothetical protein [Ensifer adhaerens]